MNELFAQLFGQQPGYASELLGEEEARRLQQRAQQQGLLNLGLSLLSGSGPSAQPRGIGQLLAQGVQAGQQAYQGAYNKALQEQMLKQQLQERQQAMREQQMAQAAIQSAYAPREIYGEDIMGQRVGVGMTAPMLDMDRLRGMLGGLTPGARAQVIKEATAIQSAFAPKRITAKEGERIIEEGPEGFREVYAAPKTREPKAVPGAFGQAMLALGISTPVEQLTSAQLQQIRSEMDRQAERASPKVSVDLKDPTAVAKAQQGIVSDWRGVMKDVGALEIADRYQAAVSAVAQGNAGNRAADGALIYATGKLLDPSGAVQEGDKKTILGNRSIPDSVKALAMRVFDGGDLLPKERQQLLDVLTEQVKARAMTIDRQKAPYIAISRSLGGDGSLLQNPLTAVLQDRDLFKKYGLDPG